MKKTHFQVNKNVIKCKSVGDIMESEPLVLTLDFGTQRSMALLEVYTQDIHLLWVPS